MIFIRGLFLGSRAREIKTQSGAYSYYELGVQTLRPDGWGGDSATITSIRVPKKLVDAGCLGKFSALTNKIVDIPIWIDSYVGRSGTAGLSYFLESPDIVEVSE